MFKTITKIVCSFALLVAIGCNNATDSSMGVGMGEHPKELVGVWNASNWELTLNADGLYYKKTNSVFDNYVESGEWYESGAQIVFSGEIDYGGEKVPTKYAAYYTLAGERLDLCKINVGNTNIWDCKTYTMDD